MNHCVVSSFSRMILVLAVMVALPATCAMAGKLDSFEKDATEPSAQVTSAGHTDGDDRGCSCLMDFVDAFVSAFTHDTPGSSELAAEASDNAISDVMPREAGAPQIPIIRLEGIYQGVESDVDAFDWRVEGGYGPLALEYRRTHYNEEDPSDELDVTQVFGLLRLWFGGEVEVDVGLGTVSIKGEEDNSAMAFTLPISYRPVEWCGVEFRPVWATLNGNETRDYDVGLSLGARYVCLRGGYRWMQSGAASLNGPYVGVSVQF